MRRLVVCLLVMAGLLPAVGLADQKLAPGKLLVATELVQGVFFAETVVLLLHYDQTGAMGLIINRPAEANAQELLGEIEIAPDYSGSLLWGGPVEPASLRALLLTDTAPAGAYPIVDSVYQVPIDDGLDDAKQDFRNLRFFIGYAGWGPGQLDGEMARGSWHVIPATGEHIFAENPRELWEQLRPPRELRAIPSRYLPELTPVSGLEKIFASRDKRQTGTISGAFSHASPFLPCSQENQRPEPGMSRR